MIRRGRRGGVLSLDDRLAALAEAVAAGEGIVDTGALLAAKQLLVRAGERLGHGVEHTVVALAGATGSGKSSLFNAIAGAELSTVGVLRPTTSVTSSCSWGEDATSLLDWLRVDRRHHLGDGDAALDGLVLLDLPDHDSTAAEHRREVDRVVGVADMVVWVLDPQKYADRAVHEGYLRPLAGHAGVLLVALHQADRLSPEALDACRRDLHKLLADDGIRDVEVLSTTVRADGGIDPLRAALVARVAARRSAIERLEADVGASAAIVGRDCRNQHATDNQIGSRQRDRVTASLVEAAGVTTVTDAVARSYRHRAVAATGWPVTRWVRRVRPDPLRRLHLGRGDGTGGRTSLPVASAVSTARVDTALRGLGDYAGRNVALPWTDAIGRVLDDAQRELPSRLDHAIANTDLGASRSPRWWGVVRVIQSSLLVLALAGGIWLAVLAALAYLRIDVPGTPEIGSSPVPVPTALLIGGVGVGLAVAMLARPAASLGARRRAATARRRLESAVGDVTDETILAPVRQVLARNTHFCDALDRASGRSA